MIIQKLDYNQRVEPLYTDIIKSPEPLAWALFLLLHQIGVVTACKTFSSLQRAS